MDEIKYQSFLSGSRVYGTPTPESDIDMVVLVPGGIAKELWQLSDRQPGFLFGKLNLIVFRADTPEGRDKYDRWKGVTEALIARKPVTRDEAIAEFQKAGFDGSDYA